MTRPAQTQVPSELKAWRREFPILQESVYLINNSLGAMPRRVKDSLLEFAEVWNRRGVRAWEEGWWEMPAQVGNLIGRILGCGPDQVSLHQNVTIAEAVVISALRPSFRRNRVVYSELNFSSIRYLYQAQADLEVEVVRCPDQVTVPLEALLDAIDERTLLVPISHVIFKSGFIQEVEAIIQKAHSVGAMVLLDTYQSCGTVPFDVTALGVDFAVGGSVKWLCGGPGVAYLYVRPDLARQLQPRLTGWMAHQRPFEFAVEMEYAEDSYRFMNGTPPIPAFYAARSGYEIIAQVGVEAIRQESLRLTQRVLDWADEYGFEVNSPRAAEQRGGHVTVNPPQAERVSRLLLERDYLIDYRPQAGIRIAPHFYNTGEEIDRLMAQILRLVERRRQ